MADRNRRFALAAIALPFLFLAMSGIGRANTITVTSLSDTGATGICVLRDAITAANSMTATNGCAAGSGTDSIVFEPGLTGTIALGSTLPTITDSSLTITGPTGSPGIIINGGGNVQVMETDGGDTNLQNLTIANGASPQGSGGGIFNTLTLTVTNCTFSGNSAVNGGAIYNVGSLTITNSTFSGNSALSAGAIYNVVSLTVTNSTFSGNSASVFGGGIGNVGTMTVTNSTFSGNSARGGGGGGIANNGSATLKSTILAAETGGNCVSLATHTVTDDGFNIADDGSCSFSALTSINNSTKLNLDPAGLQNNGGPTETIALEPNSQAVDFIPVESCTDQSTPTPVQLTTDQRGFPRPDSGNTNFCDAGAFELQTGRISVVPSSERTQIARSMTANSDQVNMAFSFIDHGSPILDDLDGIALNCNAGTNALNGVDVSLFEGTCASLATASGGLELDLSPFVVHTVNGQSYGTLFQKSPTVPSPETVSVRIVKLPTPLDSCGQWTLNIEVAGLDTAAIGLGDGNPFALVIEDGDKNEGCFDVTNAIVGNQIPTPNHGVRRRVRR